MAYSSIAKPTDYFNTVLWTGNGSTMTITGVGFNADWVWVKLRNGTDDHRLFDQVRGINKYLEANNTDTEVTDAILSTNSDGYNLASAGEVTANGGTFVGWNWLGANGTASNSNGSITSTVSANTTAGFSIVKYTSNNTAGATIGHGLGSVPNMVIVKSLANTTRWFVYHSSLGNGSEIYLDDTQAAYNSSTVWNNTTPTSSVVTLGTTYVNASGDYVAYCFAEKKGYSKFGSYTGNGNANGTFVYTGFKPAWVMYKRSSASGNDWVIVDNKRDPINVCDEELYANLNSATGDVDLLDFLSNGFKCRRSHNSQNGSGSTYIYMAFAENPFVGNVSGTAVPVTAR